jgi:DNA-binding Lrp family transcriptional regulator/DNA-binding CsgD family transcriptional regulator
MSNARPTTPQVPSATGYDPTEREQEMYRLRTVEGLTLPKIGERYGVSAERVRQILNRAFRLTGTPFAVKTRHRRRRGTRAKRQDDPKRDRTLENVPPSRPVPSDLEPSGFQSRIAPVPDPRLSRSLEYGAALLECFATSRFALRISELADMVGISRSTTHRYATTLVELGYLAQDDKRRYRLAQGAALPGMAVIDTIRLETPARTILEDLRTETGYGQHGLARRGPRDLHLPAHGPRRRAV